MKDVSTQAVIYKDIKFLNGRSKEYVYSMARGLHFLAYHRSIESLGLTLQTAWDKVNDPKVSEKQKLGYLRLLLLNLLGVLCLELHFGVCLQK
jgi:hypothetical protein